MNQTVGTKTTSSSKEIFVRVNEQVGLLRGSQWIRVTVNGLPVMGYDKSDKQTRNSVVVQLLNAQLVTLKEAVQTFGIPRSTLVNAWDNFRNDGIRGLLPAKRGPKEPWKLVKRARRLILDTVYAHPDWNISQITQQVNQQLLAEKLPSLSERHVRRFLTFIGLRGQTTESPDASKQQLNRLTNSYCEVHTNSNQNSSPSVTVVDEQLIPSHEQSNALTDFTRRLRSGIL